MDLPPLSSYMPSAYYGAEKEMDTVLAPTRVDAEGNVDTRSVLERSHAAGVDDTGTNYEGRVGKSTYDMMLSSRINFIMIKAGDIIEGMENKYNETMGEIASERPELAEKDWDFTINADNEIEIIAGSDKLGDAEVEYLQEKLEGFSEEFSDFADAISKVSEQYGEKPFNKPELGNYNITRENFGDFFHGREFMAADKSPAFGRSGVNMMPNLFSQLTERGVALRIDSPQDPSAMVSIKV